MKLATLMSTAVAALIATAAFSESASACGWKRYGYGAAAAGDVRGYRDVRSYRPYRYRSARLYRPIGDNWRPRFRRW